MAKGQELPFRSTLDDSQFDAALRRMEKTGQRVAGTIGGQLKGLAAPILALGPAIAAAFTGRAIASGVGQIFDAGRSLRMLQRETGAGVAGLVILQSKFKQAGLDGDMVGASIARLQKSIAGVENDDNKGASGAIASLGLNLAMLAKLSPDKQFLAVGEAISKIADPAKRTAATMQIFGRAGFQLGALFNKPGFAEVAPNLQQKAELMARNAEIFERISIKLERVGGVLKTFYAGVADKLAGGFEPLLDRLEKINLIAIGLQFGTALSDGAKALLPVVEGLVKGIPSAVGFLASALAQLRSMLADDMRIISAISKLIGGDPDAEKKKQVDAAQKKVEDDQRNVAAYQEQVNDPFIRADAKRLANRQQWLDRAREQLRQDQEALRKLTQPDDTQPTVVITPRFRGTALSLSSEDIARNEGRKYTGARNADATMFNSSADWQNAHGFEGTRLVGGGLSGGGLGGAYGRTGNIWNQISGKVSNGDPHLSALNDIKNGVGKLNDTWSGGNGTSGSSAGATATP